MKISKKSYQAFEAETLKNFESEMWVHLQGFAPHLCKVAKENRVRLLIRQGIKNAKMYGFVNRGPVRFYIELMFVLGSHFDTDPQYAWVHEFLTYSNDDQTYRSMCLYEKYMLYTSQTMGEKNSMLIAALEKTLLLHPDSMKSPETASKTELSKLMESVYPERFSTFDQSTVTKIMDSAITTSNKHKAIKFSSLSISTLLTLFVGWRYDTEPLYHWIGKLLTDESFQSPDDRYIAVFNQSKKDINAVVKYWKENQINEYTE
ncbi:MAG: hypothetical protein HQK65_12335 [Desulfamplus sp.]|nr:hypothetical protein [Desulfamplus sp.]